MSTIKVDAITTRSGSGEISLGTTGSQTINRTGDGDLIAFQKGGADSGSISIESSGTAYDGEASHAGLKMFLGSIGLRQNGSDVDNTIDLGWTGGRVKDIYLGGGLYVGGTGAANKLDDFEEGSWVPTIKHEANTALTVGYASGFTHGRYVKIGTIVFFQFTISMTSVSGGASNQQLILNNMPFTAKTYQTNSNGGAFMHYQSNVNTPFTYGIMLGNQANLRFYSAPNTPSYGNTLTANSHFQGYGQYETAS